MSRRNQRTNNKRKKQRMSKWYHMLEVLLHKTRSRDIGHMNFGYKEWNNKALNTKHLIDIITLDLRQLRYIIKPHQIFYNNNKDNPKQSNIVRGKIH